MKTGIYSHGSSSRQHCRYQIEFWSKQYISYFRTCLKIWIFMIPRKVVCGRTRGWRVGPTNVLHNSIGASLSHQHSNVCIATLSLIVCTSAWSKMYRDAGLVSMTGFLNFCLLHEINAFADITFHESHYCEVQCDWRGSKTSLKARQDLFPGFALH